MPSEFQMLIDCQLLIEKDDDQIVHPRLMDLFRLPIAQGSGQINAMDFGPIIGFNLRTSMVWNVIPFPPLRFKSTREIYSFSS